MTTIFCSACGAEADAACECGKPYEPAGERAAEAVTANPGKSDRAIVAEIGVGSNTVRRARAAAAPHGAPETVTGRDGKNYRAAKPRRAPRRPRLHRLAMDKDKAAKIDARIVHLVRIARAGLAKTTAVPKEDLLFLSNYLKDLAGVDGDGGDFHDQHFSAADANQGGTAMP